MKKQNIKQITLDYEQKYGSVMLLRKTISAINHILVDKKIITEKELIAYFKQEINNEK